VPNATASAPSPSSAMPTNTHRARRCLSILARMAVIARNFNTRRIGYNRRHEH
jgi:hypothetical protein